MNLSLALLLSLQAFSFLPFDGDDKNPLETFDPVWKNTVYYKCNTAAKTGYFKQVEKEVVYILNLVRQYPQAFNKTVVVKWPKYKGRADLATNAYYTSLVKTLSTMKPVGLLRTDSVHWVSAQCHAYSSGQNGYVGHTRITEECKNVSKFYGECCQYGYSTALEIVMNLLIDEGVESLGHRFICLSEAYKSIGVSNQPHTGYGVNTVLDFGY